jgi:hypothetical protein
MAKWEYAAIVIEGTKRVDATQRTTCWKLVQPRNEPHIITSRYDSKGKKTQEKVRRISAWQTPSAFKDLFEEVERANENQPPIKGIKNTFHINDSAPIILFEATDLLVLVNMAGAQGWEITGGLGLADGQPGRHETKWRIMRREL